jgi:N-acetylglucosamine-6-phosphate deacetylase
MSDTQENETLRRLSTEQARPDLADLDLLPPQQLVELMSGDLHRVTDAVSAAQREIAQTVEAVSTRMERGGRLIYVGAGTAGRVGMLDAAEAGPTFNVPAGQVVGILAGGSGAWSTPVENAEDDYDQGAAEVRALEVMANDSVIGIAASGRTPFVLGALGAASEAGALTVALVCNANSPVAAAAEIAIEALVGPEIIAGSTRLNAGTAQKVILNIISTTVMVRLGKTYGPLMVDLRATNEKLRDRATGIVREITGASPEVAREALEQSGWQSKTAAVMLSGGVDRTRAEAELARHNGRLRPTLAALSGPDEPAAPAFSAPSKRLGVAAAFVAGAVVPGDVSVRDGKIEAVGLPGPGEGIAIPGMVDVQINGYAGIDLLDADLDQIIEVGAAVLRDGVTAYLPTLITGPEGETIAAIKRIASLVGASGDGATLIGVHLEGPFLSPDRAGAHPLEYLRAPDPRLLERLLDAGPIRMVTLAPELPGAFELIEICVRRGVAVSLGHSDADAATVAAAERAGARAVTHLFNAMAPVGARVPGLAGYALSGGELGVQLIADGVHVADELIRLAFAVAGGRCSLVSDAMAAATLADGRYQLGPVSVEVAGGVARLPDGTLAGSTAPIAAGLTHLRKIGIEPADAIAAVSERPARIIGEERHGRLRPGGLADVVVIDEDHRVTKVLAAGREVAPASR